ncbi:MAG: toll/interleukin-1 receptor domain-containing protein [Clostridia bacterium]|nr:toll/interleukin-1 receptor domain-containing protein [Clostridia bacterium]
MGIFISYRRDGAESLAQLLYVRLTNDGYDVFLDVESLRSGLFNKALYNQIDKCDDFLLILPPNGLDRCVNKEDWVRLEIERAIQKKKNIIPVLMRNFTFPEVLPKSMSKLPYYNGIKAELDYFDAVLKKLEDLLISKSKAEQVLHEKQTDTMFVELLNKLYDATIEYREAFKSGNQNQINACTNILVDRLKTIFYYAEKNKLGNVENLTKALEIINQFNKYISFYNEFANSEDRMSYNSQQIAKNAEIEFSSFVELIVKAISEIPNV